jgi:hypothetical protein
LYTTNIITLFYVHWFNNISVPKCLTIEEQKIKLPETKGDGSTGGKQFGLQSTGPLLWIITVKCSTPRCKPWIW